MTADNEYTVTMVNEEEVLFNDTDLLAGIIMFESPQIKMANLTFIKSKFQEGYTTRISNLGEGDLDLFCLSNEDEADHYSMAASDSTYVQMTVTELSDIAVIKLSFTLYSVMTDREFSREDVTLTLNNKQLTALLGK